MNELDIYKIALYLAVSKLAWITGYSRGDFSTNHVEEIYKDMTKNAKDVEYPEYILEKCNEFEVS